MNILHPKKKINIRLSIKKINKTSKPLNIIYNRLIYKPQTIIHMDVFYFEPSYECSIIKKNYNIE
jgi:hypothetical protein